MALKAQEIFWVGSRLEEMSFGLTGLGGILDVENECLEDGFREYAGGMRFRL